MPGSPGCLSLTAMMVGLALYAAFGRSRFAIVAPTSSTATLSAAAVLSVSGAAATVDPSAYMQALLALVLVAGGLLMLLAAARQGQLSAFVARPVLRGFAFALAVTIVVKQLPDALGFVLPKGMGADPFHVLMFALSHVYLWHLPSAAVAIVAAAAASVAGLKRWSQVPASMVIIALAILAAYFFNLSALGVEEVGAVQRPTLQLGLPDLPLSDWLRVGELAFGLVVLVFAESRGSMRSMALAHGDVLDANREFAYFSDRGRLFQADRGRRNGAIGDALGKRASSGLNISQSSTISLKRAVVGPVIGLGFEVG